MAVLQNVNELSNYLPDGMEEFENDCLEPSLPSGAKKTLCKSVLRRAADSDFKYHCEWNSCSNVSSSMNEFNHHMLLHRRGYTQCLGTDEEAGSGQYMFFCQWQDCNAHIEGQIDDFSRHVFYHTFHQYLKFLGQHIMTVEKLEMCQLDTASRNVIPELPEKLMCRWQDCEMIYDNPYIFYSHVSHHCEDYPKGTDPKITIKCKWEGCLAITKSWYKMKEHVRSHTQAKVVACPTCGSLFASNTRFIDHLKRQSPEPDLNFECSHCNNRFASERILREHMRHHVNHYKCPLCDMTCHSPSAVRDHVRYRHSQERGFKCPSCDYKAKTATDLRRHTPSHDEKGVFSCTKAGCEKVFTLKKDLFEHYNVDHEVAKHYECHICAKLFVRGSCLTVHLKEVHNYQWPSGHKRFRYKLHEDGIRRLQTIRYESIEVSQQVLGQNLSPHSTSLDDSSTNTETTADDDFGYDDDSCDGVRSNRSDGEGSEVMEEIGKHVIRKYSVDIYENSENDGVGEGSSILESASSNDADMIFNSNKEDVSLPREPKTRSGGKRRAKNSTTEDNTYSLDNNESCNERATKPHKAIKKRKKSKHEINTDKEI